MSAAAPLMSIESKGVPQATKHLHELGERGSDVRRVSEKIRSVYRESNRKRFGGYARWKPLDDDTIESKRKQGLDTRVLRRTGALEKSLTAARASNQIDERGKEIMRFGTTLFYARMTDKGTKHQPKRKLIGISKKDKEKIVGYIERYIAKAQT